VNSTITNSQLTSLQNSYSYIQLHTLQ